MADLSKIKLNGTEYNLKDAVARSDLANKKIITIQATYTPQDESLDSDDIITLTETYQDLGNYATQDDVIVLLQLKIQYDRTRETRVYLHSYNGGNTRSGYFYDLTNPLCYFHYASRGVSNLTDPVELTYVKNNTGYLTTETDPTVPAWAKASSKPTYTASEVGALPDTYIAPVTSVNEETGNIIISKIKTTASSNNIEYNLIGTTNNNNTIAVSPYSQDLLSFAKTTDFCRLTIGSTSVPGKIRLYSSANSASGYTELKSNSSSTNAREIIFPDASGTIALTTDIPSISAWALATSKPSYAFSELTSHPTTINDYGITDAYTKTEVDGLVSGVLHYKGTKANTSALPNSGNTIGDVWHVTADGSEWAWDGSEWQELGTAVDLSGYLQTSDIASWAKAANKPTYTASEVGALPSSTTFVSSFNGQSGSITYTAPVTSVNGRTGAVTVAEYDDTALAARVTTLEQIPWVTYYTGSNAPSNSQGQNGDLYFQTSSD